MVYYKVDENYVYKYNVDYDDKQLEKIKELLISNCSKKTHVIKESTLLPEISRPLCEDIRELKVKNTGKTTSYCDTSEDETVCDYDYIHVEYPFLAYLISQLLKGNEKAIYEIVDYNIEEPTDYDELLKKTMEEINELLDTHPKDIIKEITKKTKYLNELLEEKELNKNNNSTMGLHCDLINSIKFELIDKISVSSINSFKTYLYDLKNNGKNYTEKTKQLVKKPKKNNKGQQ